MIKDKQMMADSAIPCLVRMLWFLYAGILESAAQWRRLLKVLPSSIPQEALAHRPLRHKHYCSDTKSLFAECWPYKAYSLDCCRR